jgi:hypothetical protein
MPFQSKAQAGWMFSNKPAMAKEWAAKTDFEDLPAKKAKKKGKLNALKKMAKGGKCSD